MSGCLDVPRSDPIPRARRRARRSSVTFSLSKDGAEARASSGAAPGVFASRSLSLFELQEAATADGKGLAWHQAKFMQDQEGQKTLARPEYDARGNVRAEIYEVLTFYQADECQQTTWPECGHFGKLSRMVKPLKMRAMLVTFLFQTARLAWNLRLASPRHGSSKYENKNIRKSGILTPWD